MGSEAEIVRKPKVLCLHGFRTSGDIMEKQLQKWPQSVLQNLDLVFLDAPFPAAGQSLVEGIFDPPYYEWFQFRKNFSECKNFDKCISFIEDFMTENGPFDGLLGFSQGAIISAVLAGLQAKGLALTKVPKIEFIVVIAGAKLIDPSVVDVAYTPPIQCPSLHFIGEGDFLNEHGMELAESCEKPLVILHEKGHTVPRLDERSLETVMGFVETIKQIVNSKHD